ncbi:MAG TPA: protein translocase subunit SecF [Candidatus Peribacteraceae bacterium]|nr:protein translocase subunit SecF [Candidatus Peribacteraceae bacterium]
MSFIKLSRIFLPISGLLVLASFVAFFIYPRPIVSIEFTGGTQMELNVPAGKTSDDLAAALRTYQLNTKPLEGEISRTKTGSFFVRVPTLTNEQHQAVLAQLNKALGGTVNELQYTTIGPTVGSNLEQRAFWALFIACIAILAFVAFAFRKIPRSMNPWSFGVSAIVALVHDISILVGIFTVLSHFTTFQMDTLFTTALLSIMGHSVSDTIVIFDRVREMLFLSNKHDDIRDIADKALKACVSRTVNTGLGILIMLTALFIFGSESIRWFILALIIGTIVGMYSSYFVATPIMVFWQKRIANKK